MHKDLTSLPEEELKEDLRLRHENQIAEEDQEQKRQKVVDMAKFIGVNVPKEMRDSGCDESDVRDRLLKNNKVYLSRVKTVEIISKVLYEDEVREQSLSKEDKKALDLYREKISNMNVNDVDLRPWQKDAFEIIQIEIFLLK